MSAPGGIRGQTGRVQEERAGRSHLRRASRRSRYRRDLPAEKRDSFENLLLLCLAHHEEVDGKDSEKRYPPELLRKWKIQHEGAENAVLDRLRVMDTDALMKLLTEIAEPPVKRLEAIVEQLEKTHTVTSETVTELKSIIALMSDTGTGVNAATAASLAYAAEVLNPTDLEAAAAGLNHAADVLPGVVRRVEDAVGRMGQFM
ncbi:hypothetical protein [Actinoplanes sp. NBRC 101535]|uniref:hypothetical protein n=1 Tax=Actinoplanes sp. NBRC 101535 TaxID=3032196 RepID=UPI0024A4BE27|nr:hypothetical protein [Actinoplanes sp. NBRC 101535]GLY07755.1 hypothetical protein Acsp01_81340 [Actinoplanes sp. NBRC 101535]